MAELKMSQHNFISEWITPRLQDPLHAGREAARSGQRVVGYVGADIPTELILAANAVPLRLRGKPNAVTPHADEYLESAFLPETRAIAELWLSSNLDFVDAVIFPRSSDSSQRLYYYLCELQRRKRCGGPTPLLYDLATIARQTSVDHTARSTQQLAEALGAIPTQLSTALHRAGQRATLLARLQSLRMSNPSLLGSTAFCIARAAEFDWSEAFDHAFAAWLNNPSLTQSASRVLLAGSVPPDERLHRAVEAANGTIVSELVETQYPPSQTVSGDNAFGSLAQRHHDAVSPAQQMLRSPTWVAEQAQAVRAQGVIIWLIEEDEALPWELAAQTRALHDAKIPVLALTRQQWRADEALELITRFVSTLERKQ
jgi:benzoyl-CoA reductase/2-hydroxyglutaryl-CoA dehydratase subunit BcrC/BadD/HgdB